MLTGSIKSAEDIPEGDMRRMFPRFQGQNLDKNLRLVQELETIAKQKGCTPAQLAINWVRSLSKKEGMPNFIPIPSATRVDRMEENSTRVDLTMDEMKGIDEVLAKCEVAGDRYPTKYMTMVNG